MKRVLPKLTETSRVTNTQLGVCPICLSQGSTPENAKMQVLKANGIDSYVCLTHRVCLPTEDK